MICVICKKEVEKSKYSGKVLCSSECFTTNFWNEKVTIAERDDVARINGGHYTVCKENSNSHFKGFGGAKFIIKFNNGRIVTTRNLWYQGIIPKEFRKRLPDNAMFIIETNKD